MHFSTRICVSVSMLAVLIGSSPSSGQDRSPQNNVIREIVMAMDIGNGVKRHEYLTTEESTAFVTAYVAIAELKNWRAARAHLQKVADKIVEGPIRDFVISLLTLTENVPKVDEQAFESMTVGSTWARLLRCSCQLLTFPPSNRSDLVRTGDDGIEGRSVVEKQEDTKSDPNVLNECAETSRNLAAAMLRRFIEECIKESRNANQVNRDVDFDSIAQLVLSKKGLRFELRKKIEHECKRLVTDSEFEQAWVRFLQGDSIQSLLPCKQNARPIEGSTSSTSAAQGPFELYLVYEIAREGNLEPSACRYRGALGGIEQQLNWHNEYRARHPNFMFVNGGDLFGPRKTELVEREYKSIFGGNRAKCIVSMMNTLGLQVFAPGPSDYRLGTDFLREVSKQAKFAFISTNVVELSGHPVFTPFEVLVTEGGLRVAFINFTPLDTPLERGLKAIPPHEAMKRWLPEILEKSSLIVLMSQLADDKMNRDVVSEFPEIGIVIGCDPQLTLGGEIRGPSCRLRVDGHEAAIFPGFIEAKIEIPFKGFFSEELLSFQHKKMVAELNCLALYPNHGNRTRWIRDLVLDRGVYPTQPLQGQSIVNAKTVQLDQTYDAPNSFSDIMKKERLRAMEK